MPEAQAEVQARYYRQMAGDGPLSRSDLKETEASFRSDLKETEASIRSDVASKKDLAETKVDLIKWMLGFFMAYSALMFGLFKVFLG